MENKDLFAIIISIGGGLFAISASIFNCDFFFENRKAKIFMSLLGRKGSRIFYAILGLMLFFLAYKMINK